MGGREVMGRPRRMSLRLVRGVSGLCREVSLLAFGHLSFCFAGTPISGLLGLEGGQYSRQHTAHALSPLRSSEGGVCTTGHFPSDSKKKPRTAYARKRGAGGSNSVGFCYTTFGTGLAFSRSCSPGRMDLESLTFCFAACVWYSGLTPFVLF